VAYFTGGAQLVFDRVRICSKSDYLIGLSTLRTTRAFHPGVVGIDKSAPRAAKEGVHLGHTADPTQPEFIGQQQESNTSQQAGHQ
jgi:hypothetical protein